LEKSFKFPNKEGKWKIAKKLAWWIIGHHITLENFPKNHKLKIFKNWLKWEIGTHKLGENCKISFFTALGHQN
jgi:hypothetical protein